MRAAAERREMEKASIESMELGNLIFGNSRGLYHIEPRDIYQDAFQEFLEANGLDGYGYKTGSGERTFGNDTFVIRPYYWGDDEEIAALPNFEFRPSGLEIKWYKYPMRDAYSNMDVGIDEFKAILGACAASLRADGNSARGSWLAKPGAACGCEGAVLE